MAKANLTAASLREQLHYDPETGLFRRLVSHSPRWHIGEVAGTERKTPWSSYIQIRINKQIFQAHRLAWLYMTEEWPIQNIDHKDGNGLNNKWENLRDVSQTVNCQNLRKTQAGKKYSELLGAQWCKKIRRWKSSIKVDGKSVFIGCFDTDIQASQAYISAKRRLHEGCTI